MSGTMLLCFRALSLCSREVEKFRCKMQVFGITRRRAKTPTEAVLRAASKFQCNKAGRTVAVVD